MSPRTLLPVLLVCTTALAQSRAPERFKFQAHDFEPREGRLAADATFQINPLDAGGRTKFVKIGESIEGTKWTVLKFEYKERPAENGGVPVEVSELTLRHVDGRTVVLILNKVIDASK